MSLRRVRCPHCSRRYDVTGVSAGTLLRCGGCSSTLRVPAWTASKRLPIFRIAAAVTAGLVAAAALAMALRPAPLAPAASSAPSAPGASSATAGMSGDQGYVDDPVARFKQELRREFPASRFSVSAQLRPYVLALESSDRYV